MWATTLWDQGSAPVQWSVVLTASLAAAAADLLWRRIPNVLSASLLLSGLAWAGASGGLSGLADSALAMMICASPFVALFIFAGGGAGDAKLMAGVGAWLGVIGGTAALAGVALCGILLAVVFAIARRRHWSALVNIVEIASAWRRGFREKVLRRHDAGAGPVVPDTEQMQKVPYGLAILLGVVVAGVGVYVWRSH